MIVSAGNNYAQDLVFLHYEGEGAQIRYHGIADSDGIGVLRERSFAGGVPCAGV